MRSLIFNSNHFAIALDMLLAAYLGDIEDLPVDTAEQRLDWDLLPRVPVPQAYGSVIHLVCHVEGKVTDIKGIEELENLESVRAMDIYPSFCVGNEVKKTVSAVARCVAMSS